MNSPPILEPILLGIESEVRWNLTDLDLEKPMAKFVSSPRQGSGPNASKPQAESAPVPSKRHAQHPPFLWLKLGLSAGLQVFGLLRRPNRVGALGIWEKISVWFSDTKDQSETPVCLMFTKTRSLRGESPKTASVKHPGLSPNTVCKNTVNARKWRSANGFNLISLHCKSDEAACLEPRRLADSLVGTLFT